MKVFLKKEFIQEYIIREPMTLSDFAKSCCISKPSLSNLLMGKRSPGVASRNKLLKYFKEHCDKNVSFDDIFILIKN